LAFAGFGTFWIVLSDRLADAWAGARPGLPGLDTVKGLLFVAVSSALVYFLVRRRERRHQQIERALRETDERLSLALEAANQGLYDLDVQTGEAVVNEGYARMLGQDPRTFRETHAAWRDRLHPDDREQVYQRYQDYVEGRASEYRVEFRQRTADGSWRWILSTGRIVAWDEQGRPVRMLGTHTDITESREAAARVGAELALTQAIVGNVPVGLVTFRPDGSTATVNAAAARITGRPAGELLAQSFGLGPAWRAAGLGAAADRCRQTGRTQQVETTLVTPQGSKRHVAAQFTPFDYLGESRLLLLLADVTERHESWAQLHLVQAALEAAPDGVAITDARGAVEWVNPAFERMTGYALADIRGRNPRVLKSGRHPPEFYARLWSTIRSGQVWAGEIENCRRDGSLYTEHMTVAPVRDDQGRITHFVAIKQDISEHKQLEQQLARTQRLESVGMLASGIAHDLNNIFAPILLSLELLKVKYPTADARKTLELIENAGQRGAGIVRQVLTFARGMDGARAEVQPRHLVRELAAMLKETLPRQIEVRVEGERDLATVRADATQLHQVLLNLAINARDAMNGRGTLTFDARNLELDQARIARHPQLVPGLYVLMSVRDTGSGIPPEVLEHVFEPFYTTKPRGEGTGLGLSTVYGIVKSHGGVVEVESEVGRGTTFRILLPAAGARQAPAPDSAAPFEVLRGQGRRILVVDDEESIRLVTLAALQRHGFVVETAVDGEDALASFRRDPTRFAAVITDLMMPRLGGRELIAELRWLAPRLPLIASSGLSGDQPTGEEDSTLQELGATVLLRKPYTEAELLVTLQAAFAPGPRTPPAPPA